MHACIGGGRAVRYAALDCHESRVLAESETGIATSGALATEVPEVVHYARLRNCCRG